MAKITEIAPSEVPEPDPDVLENAPDGIETGFEPFMGRPRLDGAPPGSLKGITKGAPDPDKDIVPSPRYTKYTSDSINAQQRTPKLWQWWAALTDAVKNQLVAYVYREYPPLLSPEKDSGEFDYIDVIPGSSPFLSDEAFNDKYGAGDFKVFLNVGTGQRPYKRTLATIYVKGSRNFQSQPPVDKRITEVGEDGFPRWIDKSDPQCKSYIEYLRSRGIIPELKSVQEEKKLAEATAVQGKVDAVDKLTDKIISMAERASKPSENSNPLSDNVIQQVIDGAMSGAKASNDMLMSTIKTLQELNKRDGGGGDTSAVAMLKFALEIADKVNKNNDATPFLDTINKLNEKVSNLQTQAMSEKIDRLERLVQTIQNPQPGAGGTGGVDSMKQTIENFKDIKGLFADMGGEAAEDAVTAKMPWWASVLVNAMPIVEKVGVGLLNAYMMSQVRANQPATPATTAPPPSFPGATAQPTPPNVLQMQAPAPAPAPNIPGLTPEQQALMQLVSNISIPLVGAILNEDPGDDFADWFLAGYPADLYADVVRQGEPVLNMAIQSFPPIAHQLAGVAPARIEKFIHEFCTFDDKVWQAKKEKERMEDEAESKKLTPIA